MFPPTAQPRQALDLLLGIPDVQMLRVQADLDPFADQAAIHRVGVVQDMDGAAAIHAYFNALTYVNTLCRQGPQHRYFLGQPLPPALVQLSEHLAHEGRVVRPAREVPAAAQQ